MSVGADRITLTAGAANAHALGDEIVLVSMAFDDSNLVGKIEYPLAERQPSYNRVEVRYHDAPDGFEQVTLRVNDYDDQAKKRRIDTLQVDGSGIDSYFQAWRIGQWKLAQARDFGRYVRIRADIKASRLDVGDVIAVSAGEHGLVAVPFRVIELSFEENDEVVAIGQVYASGLYDDVAPQRTLRVPTVFNPALPVGLQPPAEDVTSVSCSEDPGPLSPEGVAQSEVAVALTKPVPLGSWAGAHMFLQRLATAAVTAATNTAPIRVSAAGHTLGNGDTAFIWGALGNTAATAALR